MLDILHGVRSTPNSNMNEVEDPVQWISPGHKVFQKRGDARTWHGILFDGNMHRQN